MNKTESGSLLSYLAIIAAVLLWGGSFAAMRELVRDVGPHTVMSLRMIIALLALLPFFPRFIALFRNSYRPGDGKLLILTVLLQPCLYFLFESNALRFTSASQAGIVSAIVPVLTALGAWFVLKESLNLRIIIGIVLAMSGIVVMSFSGSSGLDAPRPVLGNLLEIFAMICVAGNLVAVRGLSRYYSTWLITAMQTVAGFLFFLPGIVPVVNGSIPFSRLPIVPLLYLGLGCTLGAFGLYNWGMRRIPAARASLFINLVPVVAAVGGWYLLGESLSYRQIIAAVIVLVGVLISQWRAAPATP